MIVRGIERQEAPRRDQPAHVAKHDVRGDGRGPRGVRDDVRRDLGVAEGAEGVGARGDEEGRAVAGVGLRGGEEDDVADHGEGRGDDEEDVAAIVARAQPREEEDEERAHDVRGHGAELQEDDAGVGVDGLDDGGGEEGETLDRDVVEEEDEGRGERDGAQDPAEDLGRVDPIQDFGRADPLGLDPRDGEIFLLLAQPSRRRRSVGQREEGDDGETTRHDPLDDKDHPPRAQPPEMRELQDPRREEPTKRPRQRRCDDIQRQPEREFTATIPSREIIRDPRHHTGLEQAQHEPHPARLRSIMHESRTDGTDAEAERDGRNEIARPDELAADVGGDLEDDVGDVEDGEDLVVIVSLQFEIFGKTGDARVACNHNNNTTSDWILESWEDGWGVGVGSGEWGVVKVVRTDIRAIDKAEEVEECHSRYDIEIYLAAQTSFSYGIEVDECVSVSGVCALACDTTRT